MHKLLITVLADFDQTSDKFYIWVWDIVFHALSIPNAGSNKLMTASSTLRGHVVRGRPPGFAGGSSGAKIVHCALLRSV